jgi:hypothetical protein
MNVKFDSVEMGRWGEIKFDSVELGTLWLDFVVLADSNWISATCYGTLRCISEPCGGGGETGDDVLARCGPAATGAADGIYSQTAIKFIYPNTAETMGGGKITLLTTCLLRALSVQDIIGIRVGPFECKNPQIISPSRIECVIGPGFGPMHAMTLVVGAAKRVISCAKPESGVSPCNVHYRLPTIISNYPSLMTTGGGRIMTITGNEN